MSEKTTGPLRQRANACSTHERAPVHRFIPDKQREHIGAVKKLAAFLGRSQKQRPPKASALLQNSRWLAEAHIMPPIGTGLTLRNDGRQSCTRLTHAQDKFVHPGAKVSLKK